LSLKTKVDFVSGLASTTGIVYQWFCLKIIGTVSQFDYKTGGDGFSRFGLQIGGVGFFGLGIKIDSYGFVI
jgi:hypothetical protein